MFRYDPDLARFEDIPTSDKPKDQRHHKFCLTCDRLDQLRKVNLWNLYSYVYIPHIFLHIKCVESNCSYNTITQSVEKLNDEFNYGVTNVKMQCHKRKKFMLVALSVPHKEILRFVAR